MPPRTPIQTGRVYRFEGLEFFAFCGMIRVIDNRSKGRGRVQDIAPADFLQRAEALYAEIPHQVYWDEKFRFRKMAQEVEECCAEAARQGDPTDPRVRAFHIRHRTFKKSLVQSGYQTQTMTVTDNGLLVPDSCI